MEDKEVKLFNCECDCKIAIKNTLIEHNIDIDDYVKVLTKVKKWIEFIIED